MLAWYRDLIAIRRSTPALAAGDRRSGAVEWSKDSGDLTLRRGPITLVANLGSAPIEVTPVGTKRLSWPQEMDAADGWPIDLPPDAVLVFDER
jgi:maltooligosyltrehalose trehalohydrolase